MCRVQPPGAVRDAVDQKFARTLRWLLRPASSGHDPALRAVDPKNGFQAGADDVRYRTCARGKTQQTVSARFRGVTAAFHWFAAFAPPGLLQSGRRSMRLSLKPTDRSTISQPERLLAFRSERRRQGWRAAAGFGLPITPESGGPLRHPSARPSRGALRKLRRQECSNAQQNA